MSNINKLNINRLLKNLDYLHSELEYKSELANQIDIDFMKDVDRVLDLHPELKEMYLKEEIKSSNTINDMISEDDIIENQILPTPSKELKNLYRQIVKLTHPDKIQDERLNGLYLEATKAYETLSIIDLVNICTELNIKYSEDILDPVDIQKEINEVKDHIRFVESTYTWLWSNCEDDKKRDKIIVSFIKQKIF